MRKFLIVCLCTMLPGLVLAANNNAEAPLDLIMFKMTAQQWVSTEKAKVTVNINATLNANNLAKVREDMMTQLQNIAKADWHITAFNRSQDSSGLEKLNASAEARIDQQFLSTIYQKAKSSSKPGSNYSISNIAFEPGLEEKQKARIQLRETLYQQVKAEIQRINQTYPDQSFSLNRLVFMDGDQPLIPEQLRSLYKRAQAAPVPQAAANVAVSNNLKMSAMVIAASNRKKDHKDV